MPTSCIEADYLLETPAEPQRVAEFMAGEQSSGTFLAVPGETAELKARVAARVTRLDVLEEVAGGPSLPSAQMKIAPEARFRRAHVTLSWPLDTLGPSLPNLLATVAGNLFELKPVTGLRLLDIRLPSDFAEAYVGLGPRETAELVAELCRAGIDFIKDDELQADGPACPFDERVAEVMRVINAHADRTGKKP